MEQKIFIQLTKDELLEIISSEVNRIVSNQQKEVRYYTRNEVCERLRITKCSLHNYIRQGKLQALKLGGRTLFDANTIDEAIANRSIIKYGRA